MNYFEPDPGILDGGVIFDTHAHYDDEAFDADRDILLPHLAAHSVAGVINCACSEASAQTTLALAHKYDFVYAAVGLHPEEEEPYNEDWIISAAKDEKCVAIGEIGLDYHWDTVPRELQCENFYKQVVLAERLSLPVIIHSREAHSDTLDIVSELKPRGVMHCFSGSAETAKQLVNMGIYLGFGGAATFKNARKAVDVIEVIPLEYILLETDAPYMAPVPFRGERCDSSMIIKVAERIAEIKGITVRDVLNAARENTRRLFGV